MDLLQQLTGGIQRFWASLNAAQKVALLSIVLITAGSIALLGSLAGGTEYATP